MWIVYPALRVYVRRSRRAFNNKIVSALDLANIAADTPGKGTFRGFMRYLQYLPMPAFEYLHVENVQTEQFASFFRRLGFTEIVMEAPEVPSFFIKMKDFYALDFVKARC